MSAAPPVIRTLSPRSSSHAGTLFDSQALTSDTPPSSRLQPRARVAQSRRLALNQAARRTGGQMPALTATRPAIGTVRRDGDLAWLRGSHRLGRGDAMTSAAGDAASHPEARTAN